MPIVDVLNVAEMFYIFHQGMVIKSYIFRMSSFLFMGFNMIIITFFRYLVEFFFQNNILRIVTIFTTLL